jgi:hypothetical protein
MTPHGYDFASTLSDRARASEEQHVAIGRG